MDPTSLAEGTALAGVPVPALVAAFRKEMKAPEHEKYVHWGASSQDILDTGLVLRLRRVLDILDGRLATLIDAMASKAKQYRDTPMAARTRGQVAGPTTFGARIAVWASPLLRHRARISELRPRLQQLSLAGASGNLAAMEGRGVETVIAMAKELDLGVPDVPWHAARDSIVEMGNLIALISGSLGKLGNDLMAMMQSEVREVSAGEGGGSSTMPHKSNPVGPETLVTLARLNAGHAGMLMQVLDSSGERDGVAWAQEWVLLPQLVIATGAGLQHAQTLTETLKANPDAMLATLGATNGMAYAEAASFELARHMPRPEAQILVKKACLEAMATDGHLRETLKEHVHSDIDWAPIFDPLANVGEAGKIVDAFVESLEAS